MSLIEITQLIGNLGEFIGAITVVATLFYLALQVRHSKEAMEANTHSLEESRKVALLQSFQHRSAELSAYFNVMAESEHIPAIHNKWKKSGFESLTEDEQFRLRFLSGSAKSRMDASYYAKQLGLLDDDYYETGFVKIVRLLAPEWKEVGAPAMRQSFENEIERILDQSEK